MILKPNPKNGLAEKHSFSAWARLLRLPELFSIPGAPAAAFLLSAGAWISGTGAGVTFLCAAALFARIAGSIAAAFVSLKSDCENYPDRPIPSGDVSIRAAIAACAFSALLSLLFSAVGILPFVTDILLLFCSFRAAVEEGRPAFGCGMKRCFFHASCRFLDLALGAAGAYTLLARNVADIVPERFLITGIFACGVFLYIYGISAAATLKTPFLSAWPGRFLFLAGAAISYGTLFGIMILKSTRSWKILLCGLLSALAAGFFLAVAYWCFRLFRDPVFPLHLQRSFRLLRFALIFLQAAAVSAAGVLHGALLLIAGAFCSRLLERRLEGELTEKMTDRRYDGTGRDLYSKIDGFPQDRRSRKGMTGK